MALLGSSIDPRLMVQDYSGFARAGATQGQMYAQMGKDVGGLARTYGDYKKKQGEDERFVEKSKSVAKAIGDMIPELRPTLDESLRTLGDKEIPLSRRKATADGVADILGIAVSESRNRQNLSLKERELGLQERELGNRQYETFLRNQKVNRQPVVTKQVIDGVSYDVTTYVDPDNPRDALYADGTPVYDGAPTDVGKTEMPGGGSYPNYGDWSTATTLNNSALPDGEVLPSLIDLDEESSASSAEAIDAAAKLTGGQTDVPNGSPMPPGTPTTTQMPKVDGPPRLPPGAVPSKTDSNRSFRTLTKEEAATFGIVAGQIDDRGRVYPINPPPGMTMEVDGQGGFKLVQGSGVNGKDKETKAERKKQQGGMVDEFTATAAEIIGMIPDLPDNAIGAKFGAILGEALPGTKQGRIVSRLNTIKANLALDKVNQMRAASPTGGAAGNMTEKEWPLFMQEFGSLDAAENKQDLEKRLKNASVKLFNRVNGTPEERKYALEEGTITKQQNETVQKKYDEMLSSLGISVPKVSASSLSGESNDIYKEFLPE